MLLNHGAHCCGVTHLYLGCTRDPTTPVAAMVKWSFKKVSEGGRARELYTNSEPVLGRDYRALAGYEPPAFSMERPVEPMHVRVKALVEQYKKSGRLGGIIEAVTNSNQTAWEPILQELGFVLGASAVNSNSRKTIKVWLLAYGQEPGTGELD